MTERLQKVMAQWGVASRRHSEALIRDGKVRVNGVVAQVGQKVDPNCDQIEVEGQSLTRCHQPKPTYILIHKPREVVSTCDDPWGRQTVLELLPSQLQQAQGLHPVGRLDQDTTGALLLTNDGDLTYQLTHPKHHIDKTYCVWLHGKISNVKINQWRKGVFLDGRITLPARITRILPIPALPDDTNAHQVLLSCLQIILIEGRKRQIRRIAKQLGHEVFHLHRTHIGPIGLNTENGGDLAPGTWRHLTPDEVMRLKI